VTNSTGPSHNRPFDLGARILLIIIELNRLGFITS
jgi:hypothetical protein